MIDRDQGLHQAVLTAIAEHLSLEISSLNPTDRLQADLSFDSLDVLEVLDRSASVFGQQLMLDDSNLESAIASGELTVEAFVLLVRPAS